MPSFDVSHTESQHLNFLPHNSGLFLDYIIYRDYASEIKKTTPNEVACFFVVPPGIEPGTHGFSVRCSTN